MTPVVSRFSFKSYSPVLILVLLIAGLAGCISWLLNSSETVSIISATVILLVTLFALAWIALIELRTKMIKVTIDGYAITVLRYGGLFQAESYLVSEIDRYIITTVDSETSQYEFLVLMRQGKRIIKLSEYYHKNYKDLKEAVKNKIPYGGTHPYYFREELKELFG